MRGFPHLRAIPPALALALFLLGPAHADEPARPESAKPEPAAKADTALAPTAFDAQRSVTHHTLTRNGTSLAYTAVAEFLPVKDGVKDEVTARVFTVTYTLDTPEDGRRPVAFVFNGGPGAASAYLHMGALGPKAVRFNPDGSLPPPPLPVIDNPDTWLRFTDLVFIDPVGTGFSRGTKTDGDGEKRFWKIDGDATSLSEIVRLWLVRQNRLDAPKLLVGESYGGFRVVKMANELFSKVGIAVNGLVMVSPVVDFATIDGGEASVLATALRLPPMAAAAAANGRADGPPEEAATRAERFAVTDYLSGLATVDYRNLAASAGLFAAVSRLTGLPEDVIARNRGRVSPGTFARELRRGEGLLLSVYDATFVGFDPDPGADHAKHDPFLTGTLPAYATAFADYAQRELGVRSELPFHLLSERVGQGWEWPRGDNPSAMEDLQKMLALTPGLKVLIAHGRTDLVTPYTASAWVARHLNLPPGAPPDTVALKVYEGGHMMYTRTSERARLANDVEAMVLAVKK
jgi:carboxypeptidase C (cathepsin A)